jgi:DNA repair exonuclease SbcCD ATPase subunit
LKIPVPAVELYKNYQKVISEINEAWTSFNLVEALTRELKSISMMSCKDLRDKIASIYDELMKNLGSIKKSQDAKESKKTQSRLEKLEKKLDVEQNSIDSLGKLKKYVEQRKNWVWNKIMNEEQKKVNFNLSETIANFSLIPPVSVMLGIGVKDAYQNICDIAKSERETIEKIIEFIKDEKPELEEQLRQLAKKLEIFRELEQKMEKIVKNYKKFEKILETPHPLFQTDKVILEEVCQEFQIDPFFKSGSELVETYMDLAFWDDDKTPAVKKLINYVFLQSLGRKIPSKTMVERFKEILKKGGEEFDIEKAAKKVLEEYVAQFNLYWQVQMMSVELALLAPELWKKYKNKEDRTKEYESIKLDTNNIEKDLPQFAVEDGLPTMELGTINMEFFGDQKKAVAECFGEGTYKFIEKEEGNVEVKLTFPWLKNLNPTSNSLRAWIRAYTWNKFMKEKGRKYQAYQKIMSLYGSGAEAEFKRFMDYMKEVIHDGK